MLNLFHTKFFVKFSFFLCKFLDSQIITIQIKLIVHKLAQIITCQKYRLFYVCSLFVCSFFYSSSFSTSTLCCADYLLYECCKLQAQQTTGSNVFFNSDKSLNGTIDAMSITYSTVLHEKLIKCNSTVQIQQRAIENTDLPISLTAHSKFIF